MSGKTKRLIQLSIGLILLIAFTVIGAQQPAPTGTAAVKLVDNSKYTPVVQMTAAEDHTRIMQILNIPAPFPAGPSGTNGLPNSANYDESKAKAYSKLPDPLIMNNGKMVTSAKQWQARRAEIMELFQREIYGRTPKVTPKVKWEVTKVDNDGKAITKTLVGHVDNSAYPLLAVDIQATLVTPADARGPVPVILQFNPGGTSMCVRAPAPPRGGAAGAGAGAGRGANLPAGGATPAGGRGAGAPAAAAAGTPPLPAAAGAAPAGAAPAGGGRGATPGGPAAGGRGRGNTPQQQLLAKGWGYASLLTGSVQQDNGDCLTSGIIGLVNKGQPRKVDDWGVLAAWSWGASRVMDYFETDKAVDAKQVGLEGHSRWGKTTALAQALDSRFAISYVSSSGAGGAHINLRNFGEQIENVAGTGEYHWMAGNFLKYAGKANHEKMPVDGHELVALIAPRPIFISGGMINGDGWQDPKGMFMAAAGAQPVYKLLGKKTMGTDDFPPQETSLTDGDVAFRQHNGGHTDGPNWPVFLTFADKYFKLKNPSTKGN